MDTSLQKTIDEASRVKILNNTNQNYFVEAGAGSGKTTSLVGRMVTMIEEGKKISHICAITFTKAAANEFYARFQAKLIEGSNQKDEVKAERCRKALQNIDLAFMGTIDSFCNMILSEHPSVGQIPSNSSVMSEEEAAEIYRQEYTNIMNGVYDDADLEEKSRHFLHVDNHPESTFVKVFGVLLAHRDCTVQIPEYTLKPIDDLYPDTIKTIRRIFDVICTHPEYINQKDEKKDDIIRQFETYKNTIHYKWEENFPYLTNALKKTLLHKDFRLYQDPQVKAALGYASDYFVANNGKGKWDLFNAEKLNDLLQEITGRTYAITLDFISTAKDRILERLRKQGKLTFNDYLVYLRDTLREDARTGGKLIQHIYGRHKYYLIDEFQDTDPIQAEIFFYLAAKEIKPYWKDCVPHPGSLFIVGDPKQSIYRFKNADVASYLKVKEMFKGEVGEVLNLYCNFRSTATVRNWFNETFTRLLPNDTEEQAAYPLIPVDVVEETEVTGVYRYEVDRYAKEDPVKVLNMIRTLMDNADYKIKYKTKDNKTAYRTLTYKDFMIITPGKPALAKYTDILRQAGIPYYVEGNIVFRECPGFEALVKYYGAVTKPNDKRYLYGVLKTNLFGIEENLITKNRSFVVDENTSDELRNALKTIEGLRVLARTLSPSALFALLIEKSDVFKKMGTSNMEYVYFALELLKQNESAKEVNSHTDALAYFEKLLYEKNSIERCPGFEADGNKVHLANLHKVKGLEAPVVILTSPNSADRAPVFRIEREANGNKGYLFRVSERLESGGSYTIISTDLYPELEVKETESGKAEELRLAYVAATRARNLLLISSKMKSDGTPYAGNPWQDLLSDDLQDAEVLFKVKSGSPINIMEAQGTGVDYTITTNCINDCRTSLESASFEVRRPSGEVSEHPVTVIMDETEEKEVRSIEEHNGDTLATISGTMVHRMMELIIMSKDRISRESAVKQIMNENYTDEWAEHKEQFISMLENVYTVMHNGGFRQKGRVEQDILPVLLKADQVYSEVPFSYLEGNKLWNGIIDLVYVTDGKMHIIDWKTNKNDEGLDEHYKGQLEVYSKAVEMSSGYPVEDANIYHIEIDKA